MVDLYKKEGISIYQFVLIVSLVSSTIVALISGNISSILIMLFLMLNTVTVIIEVAAMFATKRQVTMRKFNTDMERNWDNLFVVYGVLYVAATTAAALDFFQWQVSIIPAWWLLFGAIMMVVGLFLALQTAMATPPHAPFRFKEELNPKTHGAYDIVRHPFSLALILLVIGAPMTLGSGIGIGIGVIASVCIIVNVLREDRWRLKNYLWFYDYTKKVPYRIIPFIW